MNFVLATAPILEVTFLKKRCSVKKKKYQPECGFLGWECSSVVERELGMEVPTKAYCLLSCQNTFLSLSSVVPPKNMSTQRKLKSYLNSRSKHFPKWQYILFYISVINISLHAVPFYLVRLLTRIILFICSGSCMFLHYFYCTLHHLNTCWTKIVLPAKKFEIMQSAIQSTASTWVEFLLYFSTSITKHPA